MMKYKNCISLLLTVALLLSLNTVFVSNAVSKPKLSKNSVVLDLDDDYYDDVRVIGVKKGQIKSLNVKSSNDSVADVDSDENTIHITAMGVGKCRISVTLNLKKKIAKKKKYYFIISITVNDSSGASGEQQSEPVIKLPIVPTTVYYNDSIQADNSVEGAVLVNTITSTLEKRDDQNYLLTINYSGIKQSGGSTTRPSGGMICSAL